MCKTVERLVYIKIPVNVTLKRVIKREYAEIRKERILALTITMSRTTDILGKTSKKNHIQII